MMTARRWVSLGGWCGPSLMLSKLGKRPPHDQLPFDVVRCSLVGVVHFAKNGFTNGFFPAAAPPYVADPVSIWLLFRGQHTCFTHFDLSSPAVQYTFGERFKQWDSMVRDAPAPVLIIRTAIAQNPLDELKYVPMLQRVLDEQSRGRLDHRIVMVMHNQGEVTAPVGMINERAVLWNLALAHSGQPGVSLFDKTHDGYQQIIETVERDLFWAPEAASALPAMDTPAAVAKLSRSIKPYTELCRVEGVPALRGSCTGVDTTTGEALGSCMACGCTDGHPVTDPAAFDLGQPWTEAEDADIWTLLLQSKQNDPMRPFDAVAAVELVAGKHQRGANETLNRFAELAKATK
jgi:hypothetical protein